MNNVISDLINVSKDIALILKMFSPIGIKELCAMTWENYSINPFYDSSTASINMFKTISDGKIVPIIKNGKPVFIKIPIDPVTTSSMELFRSILKTHVKEADFPSTPIILGEYDTVSQSFSHANPAELSKHLKSAYKRIRRTDNSLFLSSNGGLNIDLDDYHGDIFWSNYIDKSRSIAGFTLGEVAHVNGTRAPNTFSDYYLDFNSDAVQYAMAMKLYRWTYQFSDIFKLPFGRAESISQGRLSEEHTVYPYQGSCSSIVLHLENTSDDSSIVIDSDFGIKLDLYSYDEGESK